MTAEERFKSKIEAVDDCWLWQGYIDPRGFGKMGYNGKPNYAHRISYILFVGKLPKKAFILQTCKNKHCVNPAHLKRTTRKGVFAREISEKGFHPNQNVFKTHCKRGHELAGDNLIKGKKQRVCRTCHSESVRKYEMKKRTELLTYNWIDNPF